MRILAFLSIFDAVNGKFRDFQWEIRIDIVQNDISRTDIGKTNNGPLWKYHNGEMPLWKKHNGLQ